jgi:hypothetical protein
MQKLLLPFCPPIELPLGYKSKTWGSVYPYRPFAFSPSLPLFAFFIILRPSATVQRRRRFLRLRKFPWQQWQARANSSPPTLGPIPQ